MADGSTPQFTFDRVLQIYQETKAAAEAMSKRHQEEMAPLNTRLDVAKNWLLDYLNRNGLDNAKCEHGMAYKRSVMSASVDPEGGWEKLLHHVLGHAIARGLDVIEQGGDDAAALEAMLQEPALALLNRSVNKTTVKELLEQNVQVPGVKIAHVTEVGVRKS